MKNIDVNKIIDLYSQTHSIQAVADKLGCSSGYVHKKLKENNIDTSLKGRKLSPEHKEKVIKTLQHGANKGHTHSLETKQNMSKNRKGSKNGNWRGGRTEMARKLRRTKEYVHWVNAVKSNADNKCEICGAFENLQAHHIKGIWKAPDLIFDVANGQCLCEKCHKEVHCNA